ncbi:MAG: ATP-dependent zinc protease [Candidatus Aenigmarchaeota archaeon]|nr:ATP-dependent zinc protease [Candidatus Aenigmarchaeota archaeon]
MKGILGIVEKVKVIGQNGEVEALALMDTGAKLTSVDIRIAAEAGIGPVKRATKIKSASKDTGTRRPVLHAVIEVAGKKFETEVNIADRTNMAFPVLVGRNIMKGNFLIDSEKNDELFKKVVREKKMLSEYR